MMLVVCVKSCGQPRPEAPPASIARSRSLLFPPREQIPNARVPKKEPAPDQRGENDRHQKREFLRLDAHMRRDRAAEIAGEQDCAEDRRARNDIEDRRDEAGCPNCGDDIFRVAILSHALDDLRGFGQRHHGRHQQHQRRYHAHHHAGPIHTLFRGCGFIFIHRFLDSCDERDHLIRTFMSFFSVLTASFIGIRRMSLFRRFEGQPAFLVIQLVTIPVSASNCK